MANPGYRPRVYGNRRSGREWLSQEERKTQALRKDAEESRVEMKSPGGEAVRTDTEGQPLKNKFEIEWDLQHPVPLKDVIRRYIDTLVEAFDGNKSKAADALGIGRTTIYRKLGLRKD